MVKEKIDSSRVLVQKVAMVVIIIKKVERSSVIAVVEKGMDTKGKKR